MPVQIIEYQKGQRCRIVALGRDNRFPFLDFIETCHKTHPKEIARLQALLDRFAETGQIYDKTKVNALGEGLFEFETADGLRVSWFWEAGYCVVCGHCFIKKSQKTPRKELETARKWHELYVQARKHKGVQEIKP